MKSTCQNFWMAAQFNASALNEKGQLTNWPFGFFDPE